MEHIAGALWSPQPVQLGVQLRLELLVQHDSLGYWLMFYVPPRFHRFPPKE